MNLDQIINMVVRTVMRRLVHTGVNKGFDVAGKQFDRMTKKPDASAEDSNDTPRQG